MRWFNKKIIYGYIIIFILLWNKLANVILSLSQTDFYVSENYIYVYIFIHQFNDYDLGFVILIRIYID
jgi:hypothetical protein